jgi:hypothetical protein
MISVIMAAKDSEKTVLRAMKSCLRSLGQEDELLMFLDGCTDDTEALVAKVADSRVRVWASAVSIGRSAARNFLIEMSRGEFIAVQDSDDLSLPWRFHISRKLLKNFDAVFGNAVIFGARPKFLPFAPLYPVSISPSLAPLILSYRNPFVHSGAIFKKSLLNKGLKYEEVPAEEYLMWVEFALAGARLYRNRIPLVAYRIHSGQVTGDPFFEQSVENCEALTWAKRSLRAKVIANLPTSVHLAVAESDLNAVRSIVYASSPGIRFEERFLAALKSLRSKLF